MASTQPRWHSGFSARNVGGNAPGHCSENCYHGPMKIAPNPAEGHINIPLNFEFWIDAILGGPNMVCASNGEVDWGDGNSEPFPSDPWTDCDKHASSILQGTVVRRTDTLPTTR